MSKSAIHLWVIWGYNYPEPKSWIYEIWGDNCLGNHLLGKFNYYYEIYGCYAVMNKFWAELDGENRRLLEEYVLTNYKG